MAENAVIGALRVFVGLDSAQFETGLRGLNDNAKTFSGKVQKTLGKGLSELEGAMQGVAGRAGLLGEALGGLGLAGAAAAAALVTAFAGARDAMAFGDEIGDSANKLKVTTDYLQEMRFVAHQLGGEFSDADDALAGFTKTLGLAKSGLSAKALKPFEALGLDPASFPTVQDALDAVIAKISALGDVAEQAAVADKLGLTPLLPAIREGSGAMDQMREKARALGFVMDAELVRKAGDANDQFEALQQVLNVEFKSAMTEAIPLVIELTRLMVNGARAAGDFGKAFNAVFALGRDPTTVARQGLAQAEEMLRRDPSSIIAKQNKAKFQAQLDQQYKDFVAGMDRERAAALDSGSAQDGRLTDVSGKAAQRAAASAEAIYRASQDELAARMALTEDIAKLAALREKQIDGERQREAERLRADAAEGKISAAAAEIAIAKLGEAADQKKAKIQRDAAADLDDQWLDHKATINSYYDQIAGIEGDLARTAEERSTIEREALAARQRQEATEQAQRLARDVASGAITQSYADAEQAALADLQAAQRRQQAERARLASIEQAASLEQATLRNQIDILGAAADRAQSGIERRAIEDRILDLQEDLERAQLREVIAVQGAASAAGQIAQARLGLLEKLRRSDEEKARDRLTGAYDDLFGAIGDSRRGFEENDMGAALGGIIKAAAALKAAMGKGANQFDQIGALAGVASGLGSAIGGTGGSVLSGIGGGAAAGASLGSVVPGIGTAIGAGVGAIIGGIGGLLGGSKAKKQAKAQAAAQAAAEAAAKAQRIANDRRVLEIALLEEQGRAQEAEALRRQDVLAALDESNRAMQQQVWAAQDAKKAADDLAASEAKMAAQRASIQDRIDELTLNDAQKLAKLRDAERAANPELGELLDKLYGLEDAARAAAGAANQQRAAVEAQSAYESAVADARQNLIAAYQRESSALQEAIDKYQGFADSLRDFRLDLIAGQNSANAKAIYGAELDRIGALMRLGNAEAFSQFEGVASKYLDAALGQATSTEEALLIQDEVARLARQGEQTALRQVDIASAQLAALNAQVGGLIEINNGVMSVAEAIDKLRIALAGDPGGGASLAGAGGYNYFNQDAADAFLAKTEEERQAFYDQWTADAVKWANDNGVVMGDVFGALRAAQVPAMPDYAAGISAVSVGGDTAQMSALAADRLDGQASLDQLARTMAEVARNTATTAGAAKEQRDILSRVTEGGEALRVAS